MSLGWGIQTMSLELSSHQRREQDLKLSVGRHQHPHWQLCGGGPWVNLELPSAPRTGPLSSLLLLYLSGLGFWQAPGTAAAPSAKFWPLHPLLSTPLPNHWWPCLCHLSLSCIELGLDTWILGGGEG